MRLVRRCELTRFGQDHDFNAIRSVADFQERVPLRWYEDFWNDYWRADFPILENCTWPGRIPYFAQTSGTTTGVTKHIPCSREMLRANRRAAWRVLLFHLHNRPESSILGGRCLMLGGSTNLRREAEGVRSGDLSGIAANEIPWWGRPYVFPPVELALLTDWEEKIEQVARLSLKEEIRSISGTPNWLLILFDKLSELRQDLEPCLASYFPRLELLIHGGINFRPYEKRFAELLEGSRAELREVYPASEAFVAIADRGKDEGLRLLVDNGVFYEFVPTEELDAEAPTRHWLGTIQTGLEYAVILNTCAGAWGYVLGDTVRFLETDPPRLLVTGRTSYTLSAFGEHLINAEIEEAVAFAAGAIGASVVDYTVAAVFPEEAGATGRHHYLVEFAERRPPADRIARFGEALDEHLCALNTDYREHRAKGYGLSPPLVDALAPGAFKAWMKSRGRLGGQNKVPRVVNDAQLFANLKTFLERA